MSIAPDTGLVSSTLTLPSSTQFDMSAAGNTEHPSIALRGGELWVGDRDAAGDIVAWRVVDGVADAPVVLGTNNNGFHHFLVEDAKDDVFFVFPTTDDETLVQLATVDADNAVSLEPVPLGLHGACFSAAVVARAGSDVDVVCGSDGQPPVPGLRVASRRGGVWTTRLLSLRAIAEVHALDDGAGGLDIVWGDSETTLLRRTALAAP